MPTYRKITILIKEEDMYTTVDINTYYKYAEVKRIILQRKKENKTVVNFINSLHKDFTISSIEEYANKPRIQGTINILY